MEGEGRRRRTGLGRWESTQRARALREGLDGPASMADGEASRERA
jgi:hypothetical protein